MITGIFALFPSDTIPVCSPQKNIEKRRVKTTLLPKPAALRLGLNTPETGNNENTMHMSAKEIFSKYMILYSVELISVSSSLSINAPSSKKFRVVISDSNCEKSSGSSFNSMMNSPLFECLGKDWSSRLLRVMISTSFHLFPSTCMASLAL